MVHCQRCKGKNREFPFTLYGEDGKLIKYRKKEHPEFTNKIVCYHCWSMLVYGNGQYYEYDAKNELCKFSTDEDAKNMVEN